MRSVLSVSTLFLLLLASPVLPQEGAARRPIWWGEEDFKKWMEIRLRPLFDDKDYAGALAVLGEEREVVLKAMKDLEEGRTEFPDTVEGHGTLTEEQKAALRRRGRTDLQSTLAGCWYNHACCMAQLGDHEPAVEALKKSIRLGYVEVERMRLDRDLDPIRELPGYRAALDLVQYNSEYRVHVPEGLGEGPAPLLVVLHSVRATDEVIIENLSDLAGERKAILVAPRGPITLGPGQYEWKSTSAGKENAYRKLSEVLQAVKAAHPVDGKRIYLLGFHQGGEIALSYAFRNPAEVAGAIQFNNYWNKFDYNQKDLLAAAKEAGVRLCLVHGREDPFFGKSEEAVAHYAEAGVTAKLIPFDGGKNLPKEELMPVLRQALDWIEE